MSSSVENHFHFRVEDYDRMIRVLIPGYETMHATIVRWIRGIIPSDGLIIELGGGTGALAATIAHEIPHARIELWDIDTKMLASAEHRLKRFGKRIQLVERSFHEPIPPCDAVVACIALHHIIKADEKENLYANIFRALRSPGIFANGDATMSDEPQTQSATFSFWREYMASHGITEEDARQHFVSWAKEDRYFPLEDEFSFLRSAGFVSSECFWKLGPMTVFGGVK
jgi:tRNA (cmo5U34)-methyltransferase